MVSPHNPSVTRPPLTDRFAAMVPLILTEWPQLSQADLLATEGDLDRLIAYVADQTEHTQTLVRRHLEELASLLPTPPDPQSFPAADFPTADFPADGHAARTDAASPEPPSTVDQLLSDLESRTEQLMKEFKAEMLPELEKKARSNLGMSLLIALGLGVILGLLLGGRRG